MAQVREKLFRWPVLAAWSLFLVIVTYGNAVSFPFLADDFFQFPFLDSHSLSEIWQTAEGLQYYRPLAFTVWEIVSLLPGHRNPAVLHALNLILHFGNGLLVGWLAGYLWPATGEGALTGPWARRYLASTLFLLYPFSYQAVSWIAAMMHPLVTLLILLSLVCYVKWESSRKKVWAVVSLLSAFLAPFAHEIGVLVAPFLIALEVARSGGRRMGRLLEAALWLAPAGSWWLIWRTVPADNTGVLLSGLALPDLLPNLVYVAQAVAYPVTWSGVWLTERLIQNELLVVGIISAGTLTLALLVALRRSGRAILLPWLWIAAAVAPAILFIPFRWLSASPRVLMLASVGVSLLWSDLLLRLAGWASKRSGRRLAGLALLVLLTAPLLLQNYLYIGQQTRLYAMAGMAIRQAVTVTEGAQAAGEPAVLINFPSWLAPRPASYALGEEGVILLGAYKELDGLVQLYTGRQPGIAAVRYDAIRQEIPLHVGLTGEGPDWPQQLAQGGQIFVTEYTADAIQIQPAGRMPAKQQMGDLVADFGGVVSLYDVDFQRSGVKLTVALLWQLAAPVPDDVTAFVHLVDENGGLIAQADGDPLAGTFPFWQWSPGLAIQEQRLLTHSGRPASLRIGLYRRSTGERLPAHSVTGEQWPDDAVTVPVPP